MGKYNKAIRPTREQPNINEKGTPIKQTARCYYCNQPCTNDQFRFRQGKKTRIICGTCKRGMNL